MLLHERPLKDRLRAARKRAGYSQERLALAIGSSRRHVIRWEKGHHVPSPPYRRKLAEVLGGEPSFYGRDEEDEEDPQVARLRESLLKLLGASS